MRVWWLGLAVAMTAGHAAAASRVVQYGPTPAWVVAPPAATATASAEGAPVRVIYSDIQTRVGSAGDEVYSAYRIRILTPQGLALGQLSAAWSPSADDITVHGLKIIRGGQTIDVLATTKFQIIQRENNLEYAVLDGQLTATLQAPGLQVGDEIEFSATVRRRDPTLGDRSHGFLQLPPTGAPGAFRVRLLWPQAKTVRWAATPDLGPAALADRGGDRELSYELRDPKSVVTADEAPARVNVRRLVEYSEFSTWPELSTLIRPLFDKAATLAADSPVRQEAARIAASTSDPLERTEAGLRLVQDRIRYVYVGLDGGNYRPAGADETWTRRFGDCKAKTALLIALLRELGIAAEPVLVNTKGGDGIDQRLPTPEAFDHVLVRATVGSKAYWLDGTRLGDHRLAALPAPSFRWALPLRAADGQLEAVSADAPALPQQIVVVKIDASAGFTLPAKVEMEQITRGDDVFRMRSQLAGMASEDADRALKAYWRQQASWVEPATVAWRYDEGQDMLVITMSGEGKPEWEGNEETGRSFNLPGAGFTPPDELRRPKEQDQTAPWVTNFPNYKCWATYVRLPAEKGKWRWGYVARRVAEHLGGIVYWRDGKLQGGVMHTVMSKKTYLPELSAAQAQEVNDGLKTFDNKISYVFQSQAPRTTFETREAAANPGQPPIDWTKPDTPCAGPTSQVPLAGY